MTYKLVACESSFVIYVCMFNQDLVLNNLDLCIKIPPTNQPTNESYIYYLYNQVLALNNQQGLTGFKLPPTINIYK